uniref:hypothetical protein n=1 Tax=Citrobacter freundii TaxID=546 RepID=UPI002016DFA2|nr:hypothetical protein [Citrobacter freundii]
MTANKPMTGEQLDELMTVAVNFQRDSEKAGEGDGATFAYAVQVAVLEIREVRSMYEELQSQNADLAVQLANAESKCRELAAENAGLKSGASYFSYGSEHHFEWHKAAAEAVEAAEAAIDDYRGDACDGWSEEVDSICWGVIMQSSTKVGERPRNEDDCCDPAIDTICDYVLLPNIETPATDAFLAEVRASAVEEFMRDSQLPYQIATVLADYDNADDATLQTVIWSGQPPEPDGDIWHLEYVSRGNAIVRDVLKQLLEAAQ